MAAPSQSSAAWMSRRGSRGGFVWTLLLFAVAQAAFWSIKEFARPELRDPEFVHKIQRLKQRIAEYPGRPMTVLLGSSRVAFGIRTDLLEVNRAGGHNDPTIFNFGMTQCTPVLQRLMLKRLLAEGVRPDCVVAEFFPAVMVAGEEQAEEYIHPTRLTFTDLRLLNRFTDHPTRLGLRWLSAQLMPCFTHRHVLLNRYATGLVPKASRFDDNWRGMNAWGWTPREQFREAKAPKALAEYQTKRLPELKALFEDWKVSTQSDMALREILLLCRERKIRVALLWAPEPTWLGDCCGSEAEARIQAYVDELVDQYGATLIDARRWIPDGLFYEEMHPTHAGAATAAQRFEREALPLLRAPRDVADERGRP